MPALMFGSDLAAIQTMTQAYTKPRYLAKPVNSTFWRVLTLQNAKPEPHSTAPTLIGSKARRRWRAPQAAEGTGDIRRSGHVRGSNCSSQDGKTGVGKWPRGRIGNDLD